VYRLGRNARITASMRLLLAGEITQAPALGRETPQMRSTANMIKT
jgi:hypothetical protein